MEEAHQRSSGGRKRGFWAWYERHYTLNLTLAAGLFLLQIVHLYWLAAHVIALRLLGESFFSPTPLWQYLIIVVDYTEIPALISTSFVYIYDLRKRFSWKAVLFLIMLNSQWLHLFWITDEFVVNQFAGRPDTVLPAWLAWVAIMIDYLELPVIADTLWKVGRELRKGKVREAVEKVKS